MGGKNALVILKDANLKLAVKLATIGGFGLTGQACTATSRIIVEEKIADTFVLALTTATKNLKVGNGLQNGVQMGLFHASQKLSHIHGFDAHTKIRFKEFVVYDGFRNPH